MNFLPRRLARLPKVKYRTGTAAISFGLDGAHGDLGKFLFLYRLVQAWVRDRRMQRFVRFESERVFAMINECTSALSVLCQDQAPLQVSSTKLKSNPEMAGFIDDLKVLMLPPSASEWQLWYEYVAMAKKILDLDSVWSSIQQLATALNASGKIDLDRANDLLRTQLELANANELLCP